MKYYINSKSKQYFAFNIWNIESAKAVIDGPAQMGQDVIKKIFAKKWEINGYTDLEEFYEAVDSVYIASPHGIHYGYIVAEAPWWKTRYFEVHYENPDKVEKYTERFLEDGLRYEISDFLTMINQVGKSGFKLSRSESITLAGVMEEFMKTEQRGG